MLPAPQLGAFLDFPPLLWLVASCAASDGFGPASRTRGGALGSQDEDV